MSYTQIPNFDDPNAKVQERVHNASGARIIDVLYGARDAFGNSITPEKGKHDGHGHWSAIEIDGLYQMIMWRHPASEGGLQEYGESRRAHPLKDLEDYIEEKSSILKSLYEAMKERPYDSRKVEDLFAQFGQVYDMNTPKEQEQRQKLENFQRQHEEKLRKFQENSCRKQQLISEAKSLQTSKDWKSTSDRMKSMMEEWKQIGYAGSNNEDYWEQFNAARKLFFERQHQHYEELDKERSARKAQKEDLVSEARSIAYSSDWKSANEQMTRLMERWKSIGSAGKDYDDRLWNDFKAARDQYYSRRESARASQESEFANRRMRKSSLVSEAQGHIGDYSPSTADRMKEMSSEWKSIGFCGRDSEDALWQAFRNAQDSYWAGKKASSSQKRQEAIARRRERISRKYENIRNLQERLRNTRNLEKQSEISRWIDEDEADIRQLEEEIFDIESRSY